MTNKDNLNNLFTSILGVKINLIGDEPEINEQMFINIIEKWEKAWKVQNNLLLHFGLLFEGYDGLLYDALDNMAVMMFGKEKADIIHWYIYESKREDGSTYKLIDPRDSKEYLIKTPKDLYHFLKTIDTFKFEIDNGEDEEDEEDEE
jgi:hypothetical protein